MTPEITQKIEQEAKQHASLAYAKAPNQTKDDADYTQAVSAHSFIAGLTAAIANPGRYGIGPVWVKASIKFPEGKIWRVRHHEHGTHSINPLLFKFHDNEYMHFHDGTSYLKSNIEYLSDSASPTDVGVLVSALQGLVNDVKSKPNDTRYATAIKKAEDALKQFNK